MMTERLCLCGSGEQSWWENDARGIPLARVCKVCRDEKLRRYRSDVLTDKNYPTEEPVEPEPDYPVCHAGWSSGPSEDNPPPDDEEQDDGLSTQCSSCGYELRHCLCGGHEDTPSLPAPPWVTER